MIIFSLSISLALILILVITARRQIFQQENALASMMPVREVRNKLYGGFTGFVLCLDFTRYPNTRKMRDFICQHIESEKILIYDISMFSSSDMSMFQGITDYFYPSLGCVKEGILDQDMIVLNRFDSEYKNQIVEFIKHFEKENEHD
ncbi:hypothetical protein [Paenibacillus bouchesdurhonensis]|uniref:hypothetical protein n=1 Tax=Paenibacillus bouchesdurhonensis TaxID=1870990 RepID=UPI000DA62578|nr:hypothetical protein [Paenibacillus bouchesdurhonensis]